MPNDCFLHDLGTVSLHSLYAIVVLDIRAGLQTGLFSVFLYGAQQLGIYVLNDSFLSFVGKRVVLLVPVGKAEEDDSYGLPVLLVEGGVLVGRLVGLGVRALPLGGAGFEASLALFLGALAQEILKGEGVDSGEVHLDEVVVLIVLLDVWIMDVLGRGVFSTDLLARDNVTDIYYRLVLLQVFTL